MDSSKPLEYYKEELDSLFKKDDFKFRDIHIYDMRKCEQKQTCKICRLASKVYKSFTVGLSELCSEEGYWEDNNCHLCWIFDNIVTWILFSKGYDRLKYYQNIDLLAELTKYLFDNDLIIISRLALQNRGPLLNGMGGHLTFLN